MNDTTEQQTPKRRDDLCKRLQKRVREAKTFWEPAFDRMKEDMEFAAGKQWPTQKKDDDRYVANFVQRQVQQKVAALYAKNPKAVCRARPRLDFTVWDESQDTLNAARMAVNPQPANPNNFTAVEVPPPNPAAAAIVADYENGMNRRTMLKRVAETLELLYDAQLDQQKPSFKLQMKQAVRRAVECFVGYVKLSYHREGAPEDPAASTITLDTLQARMAAIAQRTAELSEGADADSPVAEEVRLMVQSLSQQMMAAPSQAPNEGLVFDFPPSTSIIVDPACRCLKGFVGANWIAQEFLLTTDKIEEIYGKKVSKTGATAYNKDGAPENKSKNARRSLTNEPDEKTRYCVWELYDKETGLKYDLCDGYKDFLREPMEPTPCVSQFWPVFALTFNEVEVEQNDPERGICIYGESDVRLLMHQQKELNRMRDALRKHRKANKPAYGVSAAAGLSEGDRAKLETHPDNAVLILEGLQPGQKVADVLAPIEKVRIDPLVYDSQFVTQDMLLTVGSQEANLGTTTGATATETAVAESSRLSSTSSNVDDIDDFLSDLARAGGEMLLAEMPGLLVQKIVGQGASWPDLNREEISEQLYLEVQAASSGRPNRNLEVANFKELAPLLMLIPGIRPEFLAKEAIKRLDDRLDLDEAFQEGLPPIKSMGAPMAPPVPGESPIGNGVPVQQPEAGPLSNEAQVTPNAIRAGAAAPMMQ